MRVYLPTTLPSLAAGVLGGSGAVSVRGAGAAARAVAHPGQLGFAVTPALREWYREGDREELEYIAMTHAARASLFLLAGPEFLPAAPEFLRAASDAVVPRRVVLAADVPDHAALPDPGADLAGVRIGVAVRLDAVVSAHVDDPQAVTAVRAALERLAAGGTGDPGEFDEISDLDDHELAWYATQEIPFLVE